MFLTDFLDLKFFAFNEKRKINNEIFIKKQENWTTSQVNI